MDLEPLNPEPLDPAGHAPDADPAERRRRRAGYAVAGTIAGLALVGAGFLLGRGSGSSSHAVTLADAAALQDATGSASAAGPPCAPGARRNIAAGKVGTVDGTSFTMTTPWQGSVKVTTSNTTTFLEQTTGKVSDVMPGSHIRVRGTRGADGTVAADHIAIAPASASASGAPMTTGPRFLGRGGGGVVKSNDNGTLTITEPNGTEVKVTTSSSTVVVKTITASLSDVKPGLMVLATGTRAADGSLAASHVDIVGAGVQSSLGMFGGFGGPGRPHRFPGGGGAGPAGVSAVTPWDSGAGPTT